MYVGSMSTQEVSTEIRKTLRFRIKTTDKQNHILEKITAKETYLVREISKIMEGNQGILEKSRYKIETEIEKILIAKREFSNFHRNYLRRCLRKAIAMWLSYKARMRKWEEKRDAICCSVISKMLSNIDVCFDEQVINCKQNLNETISYFAGTKIYKRISSEKIGQPFRKTNNQKIPTFLYFPQNLLAYYKNNQTYPYKLLLNSNLGIKINTLEKGKSLKLELIMSDYHRRELLSSRITGGQIIKIGKGVWEFHASIRKKTPEQLEAKKKAIVGIDLGISVDATAVVLLENEPLRQKQIQFFKEPDLRKKKFNLLQRKNVLQNIRDTLTGVDKKNALKELQQLSGKVRILTREGCHIIAKRIASFIDSFLLQGYEVHVAIGKLSHIRSKARKGNGKSSKSRGRINSFPYSMLSQFISYKCQEIGVKSIKKINELWTSKTCHKCGSRNTRRETQANFKCYNCGLNYNADVNGAINIAKRYWIKKCCSNCLSMNTKLKKIGKEYGISCSECEIIIPLKESKIKNSERVMMIFLPRKSEGMSKSRNLCSIPQGTNDSPSCDESTGTLVQLKVEEAG